VVSGTVPPHAGPHTSRRDPAPALVELAKGLEIATIDALMAANAARPDAAVLTTDAGFERIAEIAPLRLLHRHRGRVEAPSTMPGEQVRA